MRFAGLCRIILQPQLQQGEKNHHRADADAVVHGARVDEPKCPRRNDQPKPHGNVGPLFPIGVGGNRCERYRSNHSALAEIVRMDRR